jgi:acetolactate synthase-1/2/3 large subunit
VVAEDGDDVFTVGMYLARLLETYGIDVVFGIPGVHTVELYRGLEQTNIRHVTPRHEQGAGFMADGYARVTGRPAACFIITGPGMTNIATAMAQAYGDSVPMLVISAVNALGNLGSGAGWLHELKDQRQLVSGVCEFSHTITDPSELATVVARAFSVFSSARPRPIHIELPLNIITAPAEGLPPIAATPLPERPGASSAALEKAAGWINEATSPVLLLGGGSNDVEGLALALAAAMDAPTIMTVNGRGLLPVDHPLALPCSPGAKAVKALIEGSDLVVAVGTEIGPTEYDAGFGIANFTGRSIRIDIDPQQIVRTRIVDLPIVADATMALERLVPMLKMGIGRNGPSRARAARQRIYEGFSRTYPVMSGMLEVIRDSLPGVIIVGDSTQPVYAGCVNYAPGGPRSWFCSATGFGTLGYGLPAAIGAWIGKGSSPVVCLIGDGGFQFSLQELASARESEIPIIIVLWNNRGHGEIKSYMLQNGVKPVGVDLFTPDFQLMTKAFDCNAIKLGAPGDLAGHLQAAARQTRPTLIEIDDTLYLDQSGSQPLAGSSAVTQQLN